MSEGVEIVLSVLPEDTGMVVCPWCLGWWDQTIADIIVVRQTVQCPHCEELVSVGVVASLVVQPLVTMEDVD